MHSRQCQMHSTEVLLAGTRSQFSSVRSSIVKVDGSSDGAHRFRTNWGLSTTFPMNESTKPWILVPMALLMTIECPVCQW